MQIIFLTYKEFLQMSRKTNILLEQQVGKWNVQAIHNKMYNQWTHEKCLSSWIINIIWIKISTKCLPVLAYYRKLGEERDNLTYYWGIANAMNFMQDSVLFENLCNNYCNSFLEMYHIIIWYHNRIYGQGYLSLLTIWKKWKHTFIF